MTRVAAALLTLILGTVLVVGCSSSGTAGSAQSSSATPTTTEVPAEVITLREQYNDDVLVYSCDSKTGLMKAECIGASLNRLKAIKASAQTLPDGEAKTDILTAIGNWMASRDLWSEQKCHRMDSAYLDEPLDSTNCEALNTALYDQWVGVLSALGW